MQSKVGEVAEVIKYKISPQISNFGVHPKQISIVSKSDKQKKKKKKKGPLLIFLYLSPFHFKFSSSPFTTIFPSFPFPFSLFSLSLFSLSSSFSLSLPFFPLPSLFPHFPFQNFPPTFQGWATRPPRPPLVTPLFNKLLIVTLRLSAACARLWPLSH